MGGFPPLRMGSRYCKHYTRYAQLLHTIITYLIARRGKVMHIRTESVEAVSLDSRSWSTSQPARYGTISAIYPFDTRTFAGITSHLPSRPIPSSFPRRFALPKAAPPWPITTFLALSVANVVIDGVPWSPLESLGALVFCVFFVFFLGCSS